MRKELKQKLFMFLLSVLGFVICVSIYLIDIRPLKANLNYDTSFCSLEYGYEEQAVTKDVLISQSFNLKDNISAIKLGIKQDKTNIRGNLIIELFDSENKILVSKWKINFNENTSFSDVNNGLVKLNMKDDKYSILSPGIYNKLNDDNIYTLKITSDSDNYDSAPRIFVSKEKTYDKGCLFVNNTEHDNDLYFKVTSQGSYFINILYGIISFVVICFVIIAYYCIFIKKYSPSKVFLLSSVIIGFIYMVIMTPYSVSDEEGHITTAYRYSNVILGKGYQTDNGNMLKRKCDIREYGLDTVPSVSTYKSVINNFNDKVKEDDRELVEVPGDHIGNLWQYIPASIGVTIGRVMNLGYIPLIYLARICNFAFFIGMIYLAIEKIPFGKITIYTIAMLPMALHQGMSCSYDSIVYAVSFLFISYSIYIAFTKEKIKKRDIFILALAGGILSTCKAGIFIFICFVCLIIPKSKFKNKKTYFAVIAGVILCSISMLLIFNLVKVTKAVTVTSNNNLQNFKSVAGYTYKDIIDSPLNFIKVSYNTIRENGDFLFLSTFGAYLSWSTVEPIEVSLVIIICYIVLVIISSFKIQQEDKYLNLKHKILFLLISISTFVAFMVVAFTWTPSSRDVIFGLQGRYYVAFLPLIAFLFRNNIIVLRRNLDKEIMFSICLLQVVTVLNLFVNVINM